MSDVTNPLPILDGLGIILVCLVLAVATVLIHMLVLFLLRTRLRKVEPTRNHRLHVVRETIAVSTIVVSLSLAHLAEIVIWGIGYLTIGALHDTTDAIYFSMTMYTTVGPDGVSIPPAFRGVAGFESLIGPIMVAWSTAFLVASVTRLRESFIESDPPR